MATEEKKIFFSLELNLKLFRVKNKDTGDIFKSIVLFSYFPIFNDAYLQISINV